MPRTKASAKREVKAVVDEGEGKQQEEETEKPSPPLSPTTKKKKLVKKSSNEKKRKIEEEKEEEEDAAKVALKEDDGKGDDDDVAAAEKSTKHSTKRARANKEKAGKNAMEMTKKIKEKQEKERKIKTKEEEEEKEEDGKADADAGEEEKGERGTPPAKKKSSNKVTVGKKQPAAAAKGGGRAKRGSAKLEPAVVEEAPVVKVPSSVPQLMELKQIMEREMIEHEEASASMRAAEMERIAALKALDEANKKAEFSGSHLNRVARRMKQTARKVAAQTVNAQMLEQTMITKTVKNWAKSKDKGMKEASDICMSIMNEWIDLVRNTAHLMQQQHKHEGPATESPMNVDTEKKGEETKAGEEEENPLDVKKESSEENEKNAAKREDEEKKKVEKEEQKPRGGMPPPKILPGGIKVEPNLPGPLADIYKKAAPGASKILEEAKRKTAAMHSIVPKEPDHSSVRMKVLSYLQSTFKLSKDAALTCEAALFNAKAVVGLDYKATLKKLSEDGMSVLKSGSANLDVGRVPPGLTLFMQQTKSLQAKKKRKRKSLK